MLAQSAAARVALRRSVVALTGAADSAAPTNDGAEHGPSSGPSSGPSTGTEESRERLAHTGERRIWMAEDALRVVLARDVGRYVRALRDDGLTSRQALVAVANVVREAAAPSLGPGPTDALVHDAGRCGVEAYFAP